MSYMRPSEYALWAAGTAAFPAAIYGLGALAFISRPPSRACALAGLTEGWYTVHRACRPVQARPSRPEAHTQDRDLARVRRRLPPRVPDDFLWVHFNASSGLNPLTLLCPTSPPLGMEGERARAGPRQGGAVAASQGGQAFVRRERFASVHPGRRAQEQLVVAGGSFRSATVLPRRLGPCLALKLPPESLCARKPSR